MLGCIRYCCMGNAGAVTEDRLGGSKLLGVLSGTPAEPRRTCGAPDAAAGLSSLAADDAAAAWSGLSVVLGMASCRRLSSSCVLCWREGSWGDLALPAGRAGCRPATCLMSESSNCSSDCRLVSCLDFSCLKTQSCTCLACSQPEVGKCSQQNWFFSRRKLLHHFENPGCSKWLAKRKFQEEERL